MLKADPITISTGTDGAGGGHPFPIADDGGGHRFHVAGAALTADPSGALYIAAARALVVSDLHLEQGSAYAARRQLLPPYDTRATLVRLAGAIARHNPLRVVALGDSFHDRAAGTRLAAGDRAALTALMAGRTWIWIAGNHDPQIPAGLGDVCAEAELAGLTFRHEPRVGPSMGEIAGHLHPAAKVAGRAGAVRRKCFVTDGARCVMPAFGAYTGGLNFLDPAFDGLFADARAVTAHVLGEGRLYAIPARRCAPG